MGKHKEVDDDRVALPLDPEAALRALLKVKPDDDAEPDEQDKDGAPSD